MPKYTRIARFGFEIEGEYSRELSQKLERLGEIKSDGSIRICPRKRDIETGEQCVEKMQAMEFASKPYPRKKLQRAKKIFLFLQEYRELGQFHWNKTMGFHIHVSFRPKFPPEIFSTQFAVFYEDALKKHFRGVVRRRGKNNYCPISYSDNEIANKNADRYRFINFQPSFAKHGTIEFRIFPSGSPRVLYKYLLFTLRTVEQYLRGEHMITGEIEIDESGSYKPVAYDYEIKKGELNLELASDISERDIIINQ